jgi:hypothetical protein
MNRIKSSKCCMIVALAVLFVGSNPARPIPPTAAVDLVKSLAVSLPAQCCANTCWHGFGCCGCSGACNCPCGTGDCGGCGSGGCMGCSNFFSGDELAQVVDDCKWQAM